MNKINLKSVQHFLGREEMRQINGGNKEAPGCLDWMPCNFNSQCTDPLCTRCIAAKDRDPDEAGVCAS